MNWFQKQFTKPKAQARGKSMKKYTNKLFVNLAINVVLIVLLIFAVAAVTKPVHAQDNISVPTGSYIGEYYNNKDLTNFVFSRATDTINFNWGEGSPDPSIDPNTFSVRFLSNFFFDQGYYQFTAYSDDGIRVYLDNNLIINNWRDHVAYQIRKTVNVDQGAHQIKVEYYEDHGGASVKLNWEKVEVTPTPESATVKLASNNTKAEANPLISCRQLAASTTDGASPLAVTFTAEFDDPDNKIALYIFNFGETVDGVTQTREQISNSAAYTYKNTGSYTASVQAKDDNGFLYGGRGVCEVTVNVGNTAPTATPTPEPTQTPAPEVSNNADKLPETGFFDNSLVYLIAAYAVLGFFIFNKFNVKKIKRSIAKKLSAYQMSKNRQFAKQRSKKN